MNRICEHLRSLEGEKALKCINLISGLQKED